MNVSKLSISKRKNYFNQKILMCITFLLQCFLMSFSSYTFCQETQRCGTTDYFNWKLKKDSTLNVRMQLYEENVKKWLSINKEQNKSSITNVINIPVVVHVVYYNADQNLSDAQIISQINILNQNFAGLNTNSMQLFSDDLKANTEIQFCLAQQTPNNTPTSGIERRSTNVDGFVYEDDPVKFYDEGGLNAWDPSTYFNIWICNLMPNNLNGYAQFPGDGINETYGVVIDYTSFGPANAQTTTHEIGHCFDLRHIWADDQGGNDSWTCSNSDGCCNGTDNCDDTPNQEVATFGSPTGLVTDNCTQTSPGIMYMNFMDYTWTRANFTPDQKNRMQACFAQNGPLYSLISSIGCQVLLPDLTILNPAINPVTVEAGESFEAVCTIKNLGPGHESNGSILKYYLSNDQTYDINDIYLGSYAIQALLANNETIKDRYLIIPANTSPGEMFIIYYTDALCQVNEVNEGNNIAIQPIEILANSGSPWPPIIDLTNPNNEICHDECYILWEDTDPDDNAVIFLFYDNTSSGLDGTCINANDPIFEDNVGDSYLWNTVNMPEGNYWIYATIDDGTTLTSDYSPGYIEINHPDLNSDFSYSSKSSDEDDGDGDGIIESGESFDLDIWIKNLSYITIYSNVDANLTTTNPNVTITDNDSYYGIVDSRETKKGDDKFDIQVDEGFEGNVSFQLNLTFEDESGYLFYQILDIPSIHIFENVSPSFQVVDLQIIDDGSKCNNDGIINSGENSIDYKLQLLNNGDGSAYDVLGTVLALPTGFNTPATDASYPDVSVGSSKWPETDEDFNIYTVPNSYVGIINAQLQVSWGDNGSFSQLIPFALNVSPAVRLGYNPDTYDFGIEALGDTAIIPVMIRNYGTADLIISEIENLSLDTNNWITDITFPTTINPDDTVFLDINIKRDLQENVLDTFRIHSNNHTVTTHDIVISGTFFEPIPQGYVQKWSSDPTLNQGGGWVEPGNLDNDGLIDIVTFWHEYLYVWEQTEPNSLEFELKFTHAFTGTEVYIESIRIGNCDGDNKTDIVIREYDDVPQTQRVRIFETSANDQYAQVWTQTLSSTTGSAVCQEVGNCDTDVYDEILIYDNGRVYVYNSTGDNTYATTWNSGTTISSYGASTSQMGFMTTGDTDQDGKKEIIFPGDDEFIFMWEKNTSGSGYTLMHDPLVTYNPDPDGSDVYPKVFDIDYDNTNEIVISGDGDGFEFSVFNPSNWTYEFHNSLGLYGDFTSPAISDLNGNGIAEVFMGENVPPYKMIVYEYSNGSYFEIFASSDFGDDINNIRALDLDNDGIQELLLAVDDHFRTWKYEIPPSLPDLQITINNITFSDPEPMENDTIIISALIRNIGSAEAEYIPVEFFLSDTLLDNRLDSLSITSIAIGSDTLVSVEWIPNQAGTYDIYVMIDREDLMDELDSTNNLTFKSINVSDNDTISPDFLNHSHSEYIGDSDGLIEDNESIRFDWQLFDESGIDSTWIQFDNYQINALNAGAGYFYVTLNNQSQGLYPYEIHAIDNDNTPESSVIYDTVNIIQHAPHVVSNYPLNNSTDVSLTDSIVVEFDISMEPTTINSNTFLVFKQGNILIDPLSINYFPNNHRAEFEPGILEPGITYEIYILSGSNGVKDLNNNSLELTYYWSFSIMSEPLIANYSASPILTMPGMMVAFTDLSSGNPISWNWSFGDEGISNEQNPLYEFYTPGTYNVMLIISDGTLNDTLIKNNYINIQTNGDTSIWTGASDRYWYKVGNWANNILPHSNSAVYIPGSPSNQPILNNDAFCEKLTMLPGSELVINPNTNLTISDSLIVYPTLGNDSTKLTVKGGLLINTTLPNQNYFIDEFQNLNNNATPSGWIFAVDWPNVQFENGKLVAKITDAQGGLYKQGTIPLYTSMIKFEWDGSLYYTYWGMNTPLRIFYGTNEYLQLNAQLAAVNNSVSNRITMGHGQGSTFTLLFQEQITPVLWSLSLRSRDRASASSL